MSRGIQKAETSRQVTIGDATLSRSTLTPGQVVTPKRPDTPDSLVTITHSVSQAIVSGNSVSCNASGLHTDNSYLREFDLSAFGISSALAVTQVQIGVEQASGASGSQPLTVNLYTKINPAGALTWANLSPIGTAAATVSDQSLALLTVPVAGTAPGRLGAGRGDLHAEWSDCGQQFLYRLQRRRADGAELSGGCRLWRVGANRHGRSRFPRHAHRHERDG